MPWKFSFRARFAGWSAIAGLGVAIACSSSGTSVGPQDSGVTDALNPAAYCADAGEAVEPGADCSMAAQTGMVDPFLATTRPGCCTGLSIGTYCGVAVYSCADKCFSWLERIGQEVGLCPLYGNGADRGACVAASLAELPDASSCPADDAGADSSVAADAAGAADATADVGVTEASADATPSGSDGPREASIDSAIPVTDAAGPADAETAADADAGGTSD